MREVIETHASALHPLLPLHRFHTIPILNLGTVKTHNPLMGRLNNHFALHICTNLLQFAQNRASIHTL